MKEAPGTKQVTKWSSRIHSCPQSKEFTPSGGLDFWATSAGLLSSQYQNMNTQMKVNVLQ